MIMMTEVQAASLLNYISAAGSPMLPDVQATIEQIADQLNNPNHREDMMDVMVRLLSSQRGRTVISGKVLASLREAVLSPKELANVKALIPTQRGCGACGRNLSERELSTLLEGVPHCYSCVVPTYVTCSRCHEPLSLPNSVSRIVTKILKECQSCADGAPKATDEWVGASIDEPMMVGRQVPPTPEPLTSVRSFRTAPIPAPSTTTLRLSEQTPTESWVAAAIQAEDQMRREELRRREEDAIRRLRRELSIDGGITASGDGQL